MILIFQKIRELKQLSNYLNGEALYKRAKEIIPGGNSLLSKRPEMFLPNGWPNYFTSASGIKVKDLDNHEFIDFSIMGIGTNTLGYGDASVDDAVLRTVKSGNMSTLNPPEEPELAEMLLSIHAWAGGVKFARTGGEANAIAIRIARAATGRDGVAICGYHGWHDWYLSSNISDNNALDEHLLAGLSTLGVPRKFKGLTKTFRYGNISEFEEVIKDSEIGTIMMEVSRTHEANLDFLKHIRTRCSELGIVLIFDECTSGFRENFGGIHLKHQIEPDLIMLGKALGNGYAINAVVGKREIMSFAEKTFISSTFWTERIGPSAAIATLKRMKELKSWEILTENSIYIRKRLALAFESHQITATFSGLQPLISFQFQHPEFQAIKTYLTQEMLSKGYLASNLIVVSTQHTQSETDKYLDALDPVLKSISEIIHGENSINNLLKYPTSHSGFQRLN
jgi:glutamate-1-semialdehyde 2,1-aminomutase